VTSRLFVILLMLALAAHAETPKPPVAAKGQYLTIRHGEEITDEYRWLQDKRDPAVMAHLNAENAYTAAMTADIQPLADKLFKDFKARTQPVDLSVPTRRGAWYYYTRIDEGKQYALNLRRRAASDFSYDANAPEEVLLDQNQLAEGHSFFALDRMEASPDGALLAYTTDTTGYRQFQLHIKDLATGQLLSASLPRVRSLAWAADGRTLFIVQEDATTKRADRLSRLSIDGKVQEVYFEPVEQFSLEVRTGRDGKFLFLDATATDTSEVLMLPAAQPDGAWRTVLGREKKQRYFVEHRDGQLYILTNKDAKNFRVVTAPLTNPTQWTTLVAHDKDVLLQSIEPYAGFLVLGEKSKALNRTRIFDFATKKWLEVKFDEAVYWSSGIRMADFGGTPEYTATRYRISYQSPLTPPRVLEVDMKSGARQVLKQQEVAGGFDFSRYETKRLWAVARDGAKVPLWLVYRKDVKRDGSAPLLLYGYGSYGFPADARFNLPRLSLLERGVVFAVAQVRGGNELGEAWHDDGMLMKKKNTFTDFIDSAEYLVREKWTSRQRLAIQGGSAGGLLMGAVVNMRPDLFHAVHAAVPFVDVMNTMMDPTLPLTAGEYLEWGDPNQKPAYDYMRSYSPYDNITYANYPAMLVTTSLNDSQVMYWEPAKYVAKLRAFKLDGNPLLLKVNMGAGHGGASGRYNALEERAFETAWLLWQLGIST
jgi:oligopeptidase B